MAGVRLIGAARIGSGYPLRGKWEKEIQGFIAVFTTIQLLPLLKMLYGTANKRARRLAGSWKSHRRARIDGAVGAAGHYS